MEFSVSWGADEFYIDWKAYMLRFLICKENSEYQFKAYFADGDEIINKDEFMIFTKADYNQYRSDVFSFLDRKYSQLEDLAWRTFKQDNS